MDIVGAYDIPLAAYSASGNYAGGNFYWGGGVIAKTETVSGRDAKIWANTNTPSYSFDGVVGRQGTTYTGENKWGQTSTYSMEIYKLAPKTNSTSDGVSSQQINTQSESEHFTFAKNGDFTRYSSGSSYYSRGGYASGKSQNHTYAFSNPENNGYAIATRSEAFYDFYSSSGDFSEEHILTTSITTGQQIAKSSTRERYVEQRTETTTTISSTVPTTSSSSSTSTSTTFSISTFKQTFSTVSARYWEYVTTAKSVLGFSRSWSNRSEYSASRSGASAFDAWSQNATGGYDTFVSTPTMSESESGSTSESSSKFDPISIYNILGINGLFITVTSSISVLLNDGETYWYVDNSQGDWSAPLSKTQTSFTSTFEAVIVNGENMIVSGSNFDKVVYWENTSFDGKVVTRVHTACATLTGNTCINALGTQDTSATTVSGTGSVKARELTYTDKSLLSSRLNFSNDYVVRTTTSVTYQYLREYLTERLLHSWSTANFRTFSGYTETGTQAQGLSWKGISATTASTSMEGLDKWLWGLGGWGGPSPAASLGLGFFPDLVVVLTTDTGFVAPDSSASFYTKLPEFGNWNGRTVSANLFLGAGMPKLVRTTTNNSTRTTYAHTWDDSGTEATNSTQTVHYTWSNWCIIPRGNNNFSSYYKKVNGLFASPLDSRQYAILGPARDFPFTAVLCDRGKNYTLSSTVINSALTSGSPAFPEVTVTSSVVDLEMRVHKSAFFDASFNKRVFEGVDAISSNSVQADEAVRWMQGLETLKTFVRSSSTSSTSSSSSSSSTSSTQPPDWS